MKLNFTVDGVQHNINVNADKPLNRILEELVPSFAISNACKNASCGNCMVLINGNAALSCLIPAFRANGTSVMTYSAFRKTRFCHAIERAYAETGTRPCEQCYASKTLLIGSLLNRYDQTRTILDVNKTQDNKQNTSIYDHSYLEREFGLVSCKCVDVGQLAQVVELAYAFRRRQSGR
ncbi:MAG: 2Fe-2S iron-sulfur cluster-binding protein [Spirochaetales bacterium]